MHNTGVQSSDRSEACLEAFLHQTHSNDRTVFSLPNPSSKTTSGDEGKEKDGAKERKTTDAPSQKQAYGRGRETPYDVKRRLCGKRALDAGREGRFFSPNVHRHFRLLLKAAAADDLFSLLESCPTSAQVNFSSFPDYFLSAAYFLPPHP